MVGRPEASLQIGKIMFAFLRGKSDLPQLVADDLVTVARGVSPAQLCDWGTHGRLGGEAGQGGNGAFFGKFNTLGVFFLRETYFTGSWQRLLQED